MADLEKHRALNYFELQLQEEKRYCFEVHHVEQEVGQEIGWQELGSMLEARALVTM
jgi:hypothetical protein